MRTSRTLSVAALAVAVVGLSRAAADPPVPPPPCLAPTHTVCVPEQAKATKVHTCYRCKTKTVCLPYCPRHGGCAPCAAECGKPREVRVLIKRFVKEERVEMKCAAKEVPACPAPCPAPPAK